MEQSIKIVEIPSTNPLEGYGGEYTADHGKEAHLTKEGVWFWENNKPVFLLRTAQLIYVFSELLDEIDTHPQFKKQKNLKAIAAARRKVK